MAICLCLLAGLAFSGCRIRRTIKTTVPPKILQAKTATLEELLGLIRSYDRIHALSSTLDVTYFSGNKESGVIQEIRKQPGYILLKRPNSTHLVVQNFVTKTRELELLSVEDDLSLWIRRGNKLYIGKNSAKDLILRDDTDSSEFKIPIRGGHVFEAIFPQSINLDSPSTRYSKEEASDSVAKYYVLGFYTEGDDQRLATNRRLWIERSSLTISRQQIYDRDGGIMSDIAYSDPVLTDGYYMPSKLHIDRPMNGYALDMEFKSWRINPNLADNAFVLTPPAGAQIIHLTEKAF